MSGNISTRTRHRSVKLSALLLCLLNDDHPINLQTLLAIGSELTEKQTQWNSLLIRFSRNEIGFVKMLRELMTTWIHNARRSATVEKLCEILIAGNYPHIAEKLSSKFHRKNSRVRDNFRATNEVVKKIELSIPARIEFFDEEIQELKDLLESNKIAVDLAVEFIGKHVRTTYLCSQGYRVREFTEDFAIIEQELREFRQTRLIPFHDTVMEIIVRKLDDDIYIAAARSLLSILFVAKSSGTGIRMQELIELVSALSNLSLDSEVYISCIRHLQYYSLIAITPEEGSITMTKIARAYFEYKCWDGELMTGITLLKIASYTLRTIPEQINKRKKLNVPLFNRCLAISINLLNINRAGVAEEFLTLALKIADVLFELERHEDIVDLCTPAYELVRKWREAGWIENSREEYQVMAYLGIALKVTGRRITEAKSHLSTSWKYWEDRFQTKYARAFILSGHGIAHITKEEGDLNQSLFIYSQVLADNHLDRLPLHREITKVYFSIAEIYEDLGHPTCTHFFSRALLRAKFAYGTEHEFTILMKEKLAQSYLYASEEYPKALDTYTEVLETRKQAEGEDGERTIQTKFHIGNCFLQMKEFSKAVDLFEKILPTAEATFGENSPLVRDIRESLEFTRRISSSYLSNMQLQPTYLTNPNPAPPVRKSF